MKVVVDTCKNNTVIEMGECEEVLECIPTNEVIREEECVTEDGVNGLLKVYCHKGYFEYGICDPCVDEVCDALLDSPLSSVTTTLSEDSLLATKRSNFTVFGEGEKEAPPFPNIQNK